MTLNELNEATGDLRTEFSRNLEELYVLFRKEFGANLTKEEFFKEAIAPILDEVAEITKKPVLEWYDKKYDSPSTMFMKKLGYEGVDVRHIPEYDNTKYGTVVYDLKGEVKQKPKIQEKAPELTPAEKDRIKQAGQKAYNITANNYGKMPSGVYITKAEAQKQAAIDRKKAEESAKELILKERQERKVAIGADVEKAQENERLLSEADMRNKFRTEASQKFRAATVFDVANRDLGHIKKDIKLGRTTLEEVLKVIDYAAESELLPEEHIKFLRDELGKLTPAKTDIKAENWLDTVKEEDLDFATAEGAYRWISFDADKRAKIEQKDYVAEMKRAYDMLAPKAETAEQKELLANELNRYKENYLNKMYDILAAKSRTASPMITGPAKFPVEKNRKALEAEMKKVEAFLEWQKKALKSIEKKLTKAQTPETVSQNELKRLKKRVAETVAIVKAIETGEARGTDKRLITTNLSGVLKRSADKGFTKEVSEALEYLKELEAKHLKKPVFAKNNSIWGYAEKAAAEIAEKPTGEKAIAEYEGVEIVNNYDADRTQIRFADKPSSEVISALKKEAWRWSPSNSAWQRKLTRAAEHSAKQIISKYYPEKEVAKAEPKAEKPKPKNEIKTDDAWFAEYEKKYEKRKKISKAKEEYIDKVIAEINKYVAKRHKETPHLEIELVHTRLKESVEKDQNFTIHIGSGLNKGHKTISLEEAGIKWNPEKYIEETLKKAAAEEKAVEKLEPKAEKPESKAKGRAVQPQKEKEDISRKELLEGFREIMQEATEKKEPQKKSKPKPKTPIEKLEANMKEYGIDKQEQKKILEVTKKYLEGAKKAGFNVEHILEFRKEFEEKVTDDLLKAHGLEPGSKAYIAGKASVYKDGDFFMSIIELLADPDKPITQEVLHEYAKLWTMIWNVSDPKKYNKAIDFLVDKGLDKKRAEEHLAEVFADYAMSHDKFESETKNFFKEMLKNFKEWVKRVIERLTYFRKRVKPNLSNDIKIQAEAFARGDWAKAFEGLQRKDTPWKMKYSVKNKEIKASGYDPILETYKKLFPDKKIKRAVRLPIDERTFKDVGDRRINAYSYDHPELAEYIQYEAERLRSELGDSIKGERNFTYLEGAVAGEDIVRWDTKRFVSEPIARILDLTGATYKEIEDALDRLIEGGGKENRALAKRIELIIDDNLTKGCKTFDDYFQEPNYDYIEAKKKIAVKYYESDMAVSGRAKLKETKAEGLTSQLGQPTVGPATGKNVSGKAKRASEIVKQFEQRLKATIKKGGVHWTRLGEFNNRTYIIRIAKANDIATLAHEVGHYFDKLYDLTTLSTIRKQVGKGEQKIVDDLMHLGKPTSRASYSKLRVRREGIAEFFREYFTDSARTAEGYPELTDYVKSKVPREVMGIVEEIAQDIWDLVNLDPVARGLKQIHFKGDPRSPSPFSFSQFLRKIYAAFVDENSPLEWAAGEMAGEKFEEEMRNKLSALRGWEGIAKADIFGDYQADLHGKKVGRSYKQIMERVHETEQIRREYQVYKVARRSEDYFARGKEMPDSPETYAEQIRILELKYPWFKEVFAEERKFDDNNFDLLVQAGLYTAEEVEAIKLANPNHVPLQRIKDAFDYVAGTSQKLAGSKNVVKGVKGSGKEIQDPEENMINNVFIIRSVAMRNKLGVRMAEIADKVEGKGYVMAPAAQKFKMTQFNLEAIKKYLYEVFKEEEGIKEAYFDVKQFVDNLDLDIMARIFQPQNLAGPNQWIIYINGEPVVYDVHPDVYRAVKGLTPENMNLLTEILMNLAQIQKAGIIYTFQFISRNFGKDTWHNLVTSESGINPIDIATGVYSVLTNDKWYKLMARAGGTTNYFTANDRKFAQEAIDEIAAGGKRYKEIMLKINTALGLAKEGHVGQGAWYGSTQTLKTVLKILQDWIEPSEMPGRVAEAKKHLIKYLKAVGYTNKDIKEMDELKLFEVIPREEIDRAIRYSRDLSVDFRKQGWFIKLIQGNRLVNFLNPGIQGPVNLGRLLVNPKTRWRTIINAIKYITLPSLFFLWLNWENENYHRVRSYWRDMFLLIPVGDPKTAKYFIPYPNPWGLGIMFAALPVRLVSAHLRGNPDAWDEFDESIKNVLLPDLMPSALEPLYRDATGKDWRGVPIINEGDKRLSPHLQYNEFTSIFCVKTADALKDVPGIPEFMKSPKRLQRVIEGYTGTLGHAILEGIDITFGDKPGVPILGAIKDDFVLDSHRSSRALDKFYNYKENLDTQYADAKRLEQELPADVEALRKAFNAGANIITIFNDSIQAIRRSDMPQKQKDLEIAGLRADMLETAWAISEGYENYFMKEKEEQEKGKFKKLLQKAGDIYDWILFEDEDKELNKLQRAIRTGRK